MSKLLICGLLASSLLLSACSWPSPNKNSPTPTPTATPTTEVKITAPPEGGKVKQTDMVKGTSQNIPTGQVIWIVVFAHKAGRYFPQNQPADIQSDGNWAGVTYFGEPAEVGLSFDAIAVLADAAGQQAFNSYLTAARDKKQYEGLAALPAGVKIYSRVSVTRQ